MRLLLLTASLCMLPSLGYAGEELQARAETNWRYGDKRSILLTEFWVPILQDTDRKDVLYGSLRLMGDDQDNREGNLGIGYRRQTTLPLIGDGVAGAHGWIDRRITDRGSKIHQATAGAEWLGKSLDLRLNAYLPLTEGKKFVSGNPGAQNPTLSGIGIFVETAGIAVEEPQKGFDLELGFEIGHHVDFVKDRTDAVRIYAGGYHFEGKETSSVSGWRTRVSADLNQDFQIGARFQRDDERGSQGFLEATLRFPFGQKKSLRRDGLRARLDESPERDVDIVTAVAVTQDFQKTPVLNKLTGQPQKVLTVDNTAAPGGNGSAEQPFNTLLDAGAAADEYSIIYVRRGNGTSYGQDQGITLNRTGMQLIGSGVDFVYDSGLFSVSGGGSLDAAVIAAATAAPVISNVNPGGDGVTVSADNITVAGIDIDSAQNSGLAIRADGAGTSAQNILIHAVNARNNRSGIVIHGANGGSVSAAVEKSKSTLNREHGIVVYDDTDQTFDVDLGGGALGSAGLNSLSGNMLEDLAVDYDGRILSARNNWWGQASGIDTDDPSDGIAPQIYYGAAVNDGLVGHWTFDSEWTSGTTAYDRSGLGNNGTLQGGLSLANMVGAGGRQGLDFNGTTNYVVVPNNAGLNMSDAITTIARITPDNWGGGNRRILQKGNSDNQFRLTDQGDLVRLELRNTGYTQAALPALGQETLISSTYDGSRIKLYYNDALASQASAAGNFVTTNDNLHIGTKFQSAVAGDHFDGKISDVRIYNRALTASEISELYRMDTTSVVDTSGFLTSGFKF